jgi:two-component system CheB/CheR fusion protein
MLPFAPIEIDLDTDRFHQLMVNLLGNAVKYTPPGGTVWVKVIVETGHAAVRVEDTGVGISAELQPRLFELFTQGKVETGRRESGLGIGLALVKALVALHNGIVSVRSEGQGKGSEFTVRLPLRQPGTEGNVVPPAAAPLEGSAQTDR